MNPSTEFTLSKANVLRTTSGQALVETTLIILFVIGMYFSLVQLFIISTTRIIAFDAAQSACRANIVRKNPEIAAFYVFKIGSRVIPVPQTIETPIAGNLKITTAKINYLQKVMFPDFFSLTIAGWLPGSATCRMINSPAEEYLDKSFPGARND